MDEGTGSSQLSLASQRHWRSIFILMIIGENQPKTSNILAMLDMRIRLVTISGAGRSAIVKQKWSNVVLHSSPRAFVYFSVGLGWLCSNFYLLFYSFSPQNLPIIPFKEPIILTLFSPKVTRCNVQLQWFYFKTTFITIKLSRQTYMYTLYTSQVQTSELTVYTFGVQPVCGHVHQSSKKMYLLF